ncbi:unnamed protein product, partial [Prorocentrum cordatum]
KEHRDTTRAKLRIIANERTDPHINTSSCDQLEPEAAEFAPSPIDMVCPVMPPSHWDNQRGCRKEFEDDGGTCVLPPSIPTSTIHHDRRRRSKDIEDAQARAHAFAYPATDDTDENLRGEATQVAINLDGQSLGYGTVIFDAPQRPSTSYAACPERDVHIGVMKARVSVDFKADMDDASSAADECGPGGSLDAHRKRRRGASFPYGDRIKVSVLPAAASPAASSRATMPPKRGVS